VLVNVPVGEGPKFGGVIDLLKPPAKADGALVDVAAARSKLVEAIVEADEELMMKYLEGAVSDEEVAAAFPKALAAGTVIPIFCTSAKKDIGVTELLDALAAHAVSPAQAKTRTAVKGSGDKAAEVTLEPKDSGELVAQVFKTLSDKFVGNLSFFRIY